ncbi:hypothetical protein HPB48_016015 [Haemaphysalis longicornis]|uniref:SCP domain-containing protein n=1 Tax=Haemaphysalis longicornis TaxID=44386 RepID=A0A9J6G1P8_HAELO|nr:hypothetical protein HPB48_016015 [Haemaphysalis longicornis]
MRGMRVYLSRVRFCSTPAIGGEQTRFLRRLPVGYKMDRDPLVHPARPGLPLRCSSGAGALASSSCPDLYRRYSWRHTQCLRAPSSCRPLQEGVSEADRQLILDQHNAFRNRLASGGEAARGLPAASNMMYLVSRPSSGCDCSAP